MLTIEDIIRIAKENGAEVTKSKEGCGIGYTDDKGIFHNIAFKETLLKPIPLEVIKGIKAISQYCIDTYDCEECALKYKGECLFDIAVEYWKDLVDEEDYAVTVTYNAANWIIKDDINNLAYCSKCNHCEDSRKLTNYCSCCGAKMEDVVRNYDV